MYPRTEYEMTQADLDKILDACKSVAVMMIGSYEPSSENANRAWAELGSRMGFDSDTVRPIEGKGNRFFTAVPNETESQRAERIAIEAEEKRQEEITRLKANIKDWEQKLRFLGALP